MTSASAPKPLFTLDVDDDPLPWLTQQFRDVGAFAAEEDLNARHRRKPTLRAMSAA
ncbi:hypothetical protein GM530_13880, partial [Streptococcus pneumoniae]|nr:hypothetical protein [Streptococcus pneumoniae]